jgi:hypothetical protein
MCIVFSKVGYVAKLENAGKTMRKTMFRLFILFQIVCVHICEKSGRFTPYYFHSQMCFVLPIKGAVSRVVMSKQ